MYIMPYGFPTMLEVDSVRYLTEGETEAQKSQVTSPVPHSWGTTAPKSEPSQISLVRIQG